MKGIWITYTPAELAWLNANYHMPIADYHAAFCTEFGRADVSPVNLHSLRKRKGWKTGRTGQYFKGMTPANKGKRCAPGEGGRHPNAQRTQFKKQQLPHNTKYLGHRRVSKDGYVEISIAETNPHTGFERRYVLEHRYLWEQKHGPIPEGMVLKRKGDKLDTDPENWELLRRSLLPRLNGGPHKKKLAYDDAPDEIKPTILAVAKLERQVRDKARKATRPRTKTP